MEGGHCLKVDQAVLDELRDIQINHSVVSPRARILEQDVQINKVLLNLLIGRPLVVIEHLLVGLVERAQHRNLDLVQLWPVVQRVRVSDGRHLSLLWSVHHCCLHLDLSRSVELCAGRHLTDGFAGGIGDASLLS